MLFKYGSPSGNLGILVKHHPWYYLRLRLVSFFNVDLHTDN
jgi:hypothetical protein